MKTLRVPMAGGFILAYIRPTAIVPAEERSRLETRNLRIGCIGIFSLLLALSLSLGFRGWNDESNRQPKAFRIGSGKEDKALERGRVESSEVFFISLSLYLFISLWASSSNLCSTLSVWHASIRLLVVREFRTLKSSRFHPPLFILKKEKFFLKGESSQRGVWKFDFICRYCISNR